MTPQEALTTLNLMKSSYSDLDIRRVSLACNMAMSAVSKQIPKNCKKFRDICYCGHSVFPHMDYCDICGQALDWDG